MSVEALESKPTPNGCLFSAPNRGDFTTFFGAQKVFQSIMFI